MGDVCQQASLLHICCHTNHPYILRVTIYMLHIDIDKLRVDINIVWFIHFSLFSYSLEDMSLVYGRKCVTTYIGEGLQIEAFCSALMVFDHGGIFIVPYLLWHWTSNHTASSERPRTSVAFTTSKGHWRPILTRIPSEFIINIKLYANVNISTQWTSMFKDLEFILHVETELYHH